MKRCFALILAICFCCFCIPMGTAESTGTLAPASSLWEDGQVHEIERKTFPLYIGSPDHLWPEEFPVYLVDGANDLSFLELNDFAALLGSFLSSKENGLENGGLTVSVNEEGTIVTYLRKNSTMAALTLPRSRLPGRITLPSTRQKAISI